MTYDFRANQVRLNRIISSGSIPIIIYASSSATDLQGGKTFPDPGSDVFLFVSGSSTAKTLFGGDVVISGSVSGSTGGFTYLSGSVAVLGSTDATGLTISLRGLRVTGSYMQGNYHNVYSPDGNNFFVAGQNNTVNAGFAFVHGYGNTSLAGYSHAEGIYNTINELAGGSHAEGQGNTIHGESAHAEGQGTTAGYSGFDVFGDYSHTEGNGTQTYGVHSHAEGYQTTAGATTDWFWGLASHAEGANTIALGRGSHAEGRGSISYGACTHAGGLYTIASGSVGPNADFYTVDFTQTAYGKYNKRDNTTSLFVVGDGTGDSDALRHDILRVESGSVQITGSLIATGITGSISGTVGGLPFLVAGSNVTASYNGSGQWTISANASGGGSTTPGGLDKQIQSNSGSTFSGSSNLTYNYTTNTLALTGSLTASAVVAGGVNITPVTASLFVYGDGTNRGSGSISGLFESGSLMTLGTIGKFDVEILAMSYGSGTGASWKYTTTALWPSSGNFSFLATTELAAEYGPAFGSYNPAAEWDVNFNSLGQIELTGSAPTQALPGGTSFYVQVTKKMIASYGTIIA